MNDAPHPQVLRSLSDDEREEFIEWLHKSREDDVRAASRSAMKRYVRSVTAGFLLLVVGIIVAFQVNRHDTTDARKDAIAQVQKESDAQFKQIVDSGNAVAVAGCNRDYTTRVEFRKLLLRGKTALRANLARKDINRTQYDEAIKFYDRSLRENPLIDCRMATKAVTIDPERNVVIPQPFYPGYRTDSNSG